MRARLQVLSVVCCGDGPGQTHVAIILDVLLMADVNLMMLALAALSKYSSDGSPSNCNFEVFLVCSSRVSRIPLNNYWMTSQLSSVSQE